MLEASKVPFLFPSSAGKQDSMILKNIINSIPEIHFSSWVISYLISTQPCTSSSKFNCSSSSSSTSCPAQLINGSLKSHFSKPFPNPYIPSLQKIRRHKKAPILHCQDQVDILLRNHMNLLANSLSRHNHFIFYFMHFGYSELNRPDQPGLAWDYRLCRNQTFRCCCSLLPLLKKTRQGLGKENNRPLGHKDIILATCQKSHVKKNRNCGKRTSSGLFFQLPLMEFFISLGKTKKMQILWTAGTSMNWLLWKEPAFKGETAWGFGQCPSLWLSFYLPFHAQWLRSTQTS